MAKVPIDAAPGFRAAHDPPTGLILIDGPGFSGIATLEQWEEAERAIRQARHRVRMDAYEGKWPTGFLKQIAGI